MQFLLHVGTGAVRWPARLILTILYAVLSLELIKIVAVYYMCLYICTYISANDRCCWYTVVEMKPRRGVQNLQLWLLWPRSSHTLLRYLVSCGVITSYVSRDNLQADPNTADLGEDVWVRDPVPPSNIKLSGLRIKDFKTNLSSIP